MKRGIAAAALAALTLGVVVPTASGQAQAPPPVVAEPSIATEVSPNKIDVMGIWAHPDDDASFTTPCGVWSERYDVDCGLIMLTRGEGGSNSVGDEAGPDLGLRRENEDRASHYRSGTLDIYNIDAADFFYNTSAALSEEVWAEQEMLRQVVHVLRQTQPEILVGWAPTPAGHGHHQYAGRIIWEAAAAAADPTMYPEQLSGPDSVDAWQVKMISGGASTSGDGGTEGPSCNAGFVPADDNPFTVVGTWSGYDSPFEWLPGNVQDQEPGTPMTWAQAGREGNRAHPTQARMKHTGIWDPECLRYGIAQSVVPFQPNGSEDNARDDAILFGAVIADPGGMPLGSTYTIEAEDYFQAPDESFEVVVAGRSGAGTIAAGDVTLDVPEGWSVSEPQQLGPITEDDEASVTFEVTAPADTDYGRYGMSATFDNGAVTAYNDTRVEIIAGVEGRFERWGNYSAYDVWAEQYTYVAGRSAAETQIGAGESVTVPVVVTNRTAAAQSGTVSLEVEDALQVTDPAPFADLAPGAETTVELTLTHTDPSDIGGYIADIPIVTDVEGGATSSETLRTYVVPTTVIPQAESAPELDAQADDVYGEPIAIGQRWQGPECDPDGVDCGSGSEARMAWHEDDLYIVAEVTDDVVSAAAPPERCFGHWLVDSVEILLDPQATSRDTSTTFKSGIMPFTDDPENRAGNGVDGPCWSRDADNHQGFSSGPLADTIEGAPNSPGQEVVVDVTRTAENTYEGGSYTIEVKIPLANLPAAVSPASQAPTGDLVTNEVDPTFMGLNITPYDADNQAFIGETRLAWSAFGSQQSEPYRWGHAYLEGYEPPSDRSTEPSAPIIPDTALRGVESPQTIYQSAVRGVTIAGLPASRALEVNDVEIHDGSVTVSVDADEAGTVRAYAWYGNAAIIPVWVSSCEGDEYGFSTCSEEDGAAAPWGEDMGGQLLGSALSEISAGTSTFSLELDADALAALEADGSILLSWESTDGGVNAWSFPVVAGEEPTEEPTTEVPTDEPTTQEPTTEPTTAPVPPTEGPTTDPAPPVDGGDGTLPSTGVNVLTVALVALMVAALGGAATLGVRRLRSES